LQLQEETATAAAKLAVTSSKAREDRDALDKSTEAIASLSQQIQQLEQGKQFVDDFDTIICQRR
jgi:hypothetical protein